MLKTQKLIRQEIKCKPDQMSDACITLVAMEIFVSISKAPKSFTNTRHNRLLLCVSATSSFKLELMCVVA